MSCLSAPSRSRPSAAGRGWWPWYSAPSAWGWRRGCFICSCAPAAGTPTAPSASNCGHRRARGPGQNLQRRRRSAGSEQQLLDAPRLAPRDARRQALLAAEGLADILDLDADSLLESFRDRRSNDCLLRYRVDRTTADRVRAFCEDNGITGIRINQDSNGGIRRGSSSRRCWGSPMWTTPGSPGWSCSTTACSPARTAWC